jgi:hypothetical protein
MATDLQVSPQMEVLLSGSYPKQLQMMFRMFLDHINQEPLIDVLLAQWQSSTLHLTLRRPGGSSFREMALEAVQYCGRGFRERHLRAQYLRSF